MKTITFKQFWTDYREYYDIKEKRMIIRGQRELDDVIFDLYDVENYEFDYDREIVELY